MGRFRVTQKGLPWMLLIVYPKSPFPWETEYTTVPYSLFKIFVNTEVHMIEFYQLRTQCQTNPRCHCWEAVQAHRHSASI